MNRSHALINDVIKELIDYQLKPHNLTYENILNDEDWFNKYTTTQEAQDAFYEYATNLISKKLKMNKKIARKEAGWFILQWGLRVKNQDEIIEKEHLEKNI